MNMSKMGFNFKPTAMTFNIVLTLFLAIFVIDAIGFMGESTSSEERGCDNSKLRYERGFPIDFESAEIIYHDKCPDESINPESILKFTKKSVYNPSIFVLDFARLPYSHILYQYNLYTEENETFLMKSIIKLNN